MSKITAEFCEELCKCELKRQLRIAFERTLKYSIKENVAEILDLTQDIIDEFKTLFESIVDDCNYKFNHKEFCSSYYKKLHHYTFTNKNLGSYVDFLESTLDIKIDDIINTICSNETVPKEKIRTGHCSVIFDSELPELDSIVTKTVREILDIKSKVQADFIVADFATEFKDYYLSYYKLLLNHNNKNISMFTIDTLNKAIKERLLKKDNIDKFRVKSKYCTNIDDIIQKEVIDKINEIDLNNDVNQKILKVIGGVLPWDTELENFTNIHLELEDIRGDFECIERVFAREFQEYLFTFFLMFHNGHTSPTHIEYVLSEEACIAAMDEEIAAMEEEDYYLEPFELMVNRGN